MKFARQKDSARLAGKARQNRTAYANPSEFNHSGRAGSIHEPH